MIQFNQETCGDLGAALSREWLETNGLGGFASSTIIGLNTRRYHGLLVAATKPPVGRLVLLSKLEETLFIDGRPFDLSANRYPGVVHPQGFRYLKQFRLDPFPIFTYEVEGIEIEKTVFMVHGENSTVVHYELKKDNHPESPENLRLEIRPLIAFRDYQSTTHENGAISAAVDESPGLATVTPYQGLPSLHLAHNASELRRAGDWYRNLEYDAERERGLDFSEDLFNPCVLRFDLRLCRQASVIASTEKRDAADIAEYRQAAVTRQRNAVVSSPIENGFAQTLAAAADQYIVSRGDQKTVIAGYHWFSDWGRDTMIALPGLTLPTGKFEVARSILRTFARNVDQGMLPNRFPEAGETPEYNTVDATLWFFEAARAFLEYTGDLEFVQNDLYPVLTDIIAWHVRGTRYGIKVDPSGLLASGEPGVQLTWMDAKVGDWVVTPRTGKAVEINALWYNALRAMAGFARHLRPPAGPWDALADRVKAGFERFWTESAGYCYDVLASPEGHDEALRPNQIFAVSLRESPLSLDRQKKVVDACARHLLTSYGLRSLAPGHAHYRGHYGGDRTSRDGAYHQGTVWGWLLGPFALAHCRVYGDAAAARAFLAPLADHLADYGVGSIAEIFDGDPPFAPAGCIAQAWSVAETLRAWHDLGPA